MRDSVRFNDLRNVFVQKVAFPIYIEAFTDVEYWSLALQRQNCCLKVEVVEPFHKRSLRKRPKKEGLRREVWESLP